MINRSHTINRLVFHKLDDLLPLFTTLLQIISFTESNSKMVVGSGSCVGYLNEQLVCIGAGKGIWDKKMRKEAPIDGLRLEVLVMLQIAVQFEDGKWLRTQKGKISVAVSYCS